MARKRDQHRIASNIFRVFRSVTIVLFLLFSFFSSNGCKVTTNKKNEYPIGIYAPGPSTNYSKLRDVGFTHVVSSANLPNLDAAHSAGLQVIASPGLQAKAELDYKKIWNTVKKADKHPALYAWYLIDEPDMSKTSPRHVLDLHKYLKAKALKKPTALVMFKGYEAYDYAQIPDIMMLDRYPVGWQPVETFNKHLRLARYAAGPQKPLFAVIQTFDWSYYPQVFDVKERETRPPSLEELRNMTWSSLALGATGIFYYSYKDSRWSMEEHPQEWANLQQVVSEIRLFEPLFSAEHAWWEKRIQYINPAQSFNAAFDPSILSTKLLVKKANSHLPAGEYILCINTTAQPIEFRISLPGIYNGRVLSRSVPETVSYFSESRDGFIVEKLEPFQARIYGPLRLY
ncbi:MAG: hypothetical protein ACOX2U_07510 [Limisphaerales bacterium]|jgi:hypothetical protein|nr:hypothetical protein [Verrucomicrobiota bacterium]